jgi:hypothetical protein
MKDSIGAQLVTFSAPGFLARILIDQKGVVIRSMVESVYLLRPL